MRNLLATLLLSQGTPMMLAGDERAQTQGGNNNAYCQDNETVWIDWERDTTEGRLAQFVRDLPALRQSHPILTRGRLFNGKYNEDADVGDLTWSNPAGREMTDGDWNDGGRRSVGLLLEGRAQASGVRDHASHASLLVVINAYHDGAISRSLMTRGLAQLDDAAVHGCRRCG